MAKTEFGQDLSSNSANSVYLLKTEDDIITGVLAFQNGVDISKHIVDVQEYIYTITDILGVVGEFDPNAKIYASTEIIANGDNRKVAIEKLDAQVKINLDGIASNLVLITQNASDIADILASIGLSSTLAPIGVGIAPLDADAKIPLIHLPNSLLLYTGTWDASTNTPTLANTDTGVENFWYRVNVAGSVDFGAGAISFNVGDKVVNNGTIWEKWDTNDEVTSVNGYTGDVVITKTDLGLDNVTNDAQLKRDAGDFNTFTEKLEPVEDDIVLIEDSEDAFNKKKVKLANMLGGGGAGGGSFVWTLGDIGPIDGYSDGLVTLDFDGESSQEIVAMVTVPEKYKAGEQIFLKDALFFSADNANNVFFRCETALLKLGEDATSLTNKHVSSNSEKTLTTTNSLEAMGDIDLCNATGEINTVAIAPFDILVIKLFRDNTNETISSIENAKFLKFSARVDFAL